MFLSQILIENGLYLSDYVELGMRLNFKVTKKKINWYSDLKKKLNLLAFSNKLIRDYNVNKDFIPKKVATKLMIDTTYKSKIKEWILSKDDTGYLYGRTITKLTKEQKIWMEHWVPVDNSLMPYSPNSGPLYLQLCKGCKEDYNEIRKGNFKKLLGKRENITKCVKILSPNNAISI